MMRPRGFMAIPGDAFGDDDERPSPWQQLFWSHAFWIGGCSVATLWVSCLGVDQAQEGRWSAAALSGALAVLNGWTIRRRWRAWRARASTASN